MAVVMIEWDLISVHIGIPRSSQKFYRRSDFLEKLGARTTHPHFPFVGPPVLGAETQF
jgi:hypothetical protein